LALAACSNVNALVDTTTSGCTPEVPWAAQNNVMLIGLSLGAASMKDPISASTGWNSEPPVDVLPNTNNISAGEALFLPVGYQSNISNLKASAAKVGFAGRVDVQYGMRQGMFGAFLYAGLGLNQAKTTSNADSINNSRIQNEYIQSESNANMYVFDNLVSAEAHTPYLKAPSANPKVTITSGLNFQAGARMGVWVNNMFFHGIVGWQCLNLQSKVSNVYTAFERTCTMRDFAGAEIENASAPNLVDGTKFGTLSSFTKNTWTNALVLGAGIDFAHQKWTYGFYYQAAICQRTNFKYNNFVVGATQNIMKDENQELTLVQTYEKSPVTVSIQPVISTFMMTVKYAFHKA